MTVYAVVTEEGGLASPVVYAKEPDAQAWADNAPRSFFFPTKLHVKELALWSGQ